ncbi:hypothetical protein ACLB2K_066727 [Fragaria x ananassa]
MSPGLFEAIARSDIQAFKDLIQNDEGFLMQKTGETKNSVLHLAARFAWKVDTNGCLPLHIACEKGHLEIARTLLMIDPNFALEFDHYRYTPVHLAAMNGQIKILEELLLCSPKCLESLTGDGETVFHLSGSYILPSLQGNITLSEHIIKNTTVDVNCRNQRGQTAMDILCQQRRGSDIRNMLKSFGGRTSTELLSPNIDEIYSVTTTSESPRVVLEQEFEMLFEGIMHPGSDEYD